MRIDNHTGLVLEGGGMIAVIRPVRPVEVSRVEKYIAKLIALYHEGYEVAEKILSDSNEGSISRG